MKRIFAWFGIILIVLLVLALVIMSAAGVSANAIMAILLCLLILPVMFYAFQMAYGISRRNREEKTDAKNSGAQKKSGQPNKRH